MSNGGSIGLPPDIQEQVNRQQGRGGVGGGAAENAASARQRNIAMGRVDAADAVPSGETADEESAAEELQVCPAGNCRTSLEGEWDYCAKCGADLVREGPAKRIGVEFTDEDVQNYLFKGYVTRELTVLGSHRAMVRTSQPKDLNSVDKYMMDGAWKKNDDGSDREVSDFYMRQVNHIAFCAVGLEKLDGESVGETMDEKMQWLMNTGSALADLLSTRVVWFNQAWTRYLEGKDRLSGS